MTSSRSSPSSPAFLGFLAVAVDLFDQLPPRATSWSTTRPASTGYTYRSIDFTLRVGFRVDQITFVMLAAVTFVGMLVQIYSTGYMAHKDEHGHKHYEVRYGWYFAVLSLFVASMLTLVLADNFLLLYVSWEGVGVCSFLLIGYYFERRSAAEAAKKAFITTRVGDVGLLIGIILLWRADRHLRHPARSSTGRGRAAIGATYLTVATLFLFARRHGQVARSSRSTSGCRTRWRARPRSAP